MNFLTRKHFDNNKRPLTISEKANISKSKNNLRLDIYDYFKDIATASNSYIHPDIFVTDNCDRKTLLKSLIICDCRLLMYAFELLNNLVKCQNAPYISIINPYAEYTKLCNCIFAVCWINL